MADSPARVDPAPIMRTDVLHDRAQELVCGIDIEVQHCVLYAIRQRRPRAHRQKAQAQEVTSRAERSGQGGSWLACPTRWAEVGRQQAAKAMPAGCVATLASSGDVVGGSGCGVGGVQRRGDGRDAFRGRRVQAGEKGEGDRGVEAEILARAQAVGAQRRVSPPGRGPSEGGAREAVRPAHAGG